MDEKWISGLVSVVVPVYNRASLVGRTLDSILGQSYPRVEVVAANDGSTDDSLAVLRRYAARHPGRVRVVDQPNCGQVRARNHGLTVARGEYIAFLDSDDTWEPEKLALQIPLFRDRVGLVYSGIHEVDSAGRITNTVLCEKGLRGDIYGELLVRNRMTGGTVVVTREALERVGGFDESFRAAENWDLWIRIAREYQVDYVNEPLTRYLKHAGNMSLDGSRMSRAALEVLRKHLPVRPLEPKLAAVYREAYANYHYSLGVAAFSSGSYACARSSFLQCWRYRFLYRDSAARFLRSLFGVKLNRALGSLKAAVAQ